MAPRRARAPNDVPRPTANVSHVPYSHAHPQTTPHVIPARSYTSFTLHPHRIPPPHHIHTLLWENMLFGHADDEAQFRMVMHADAGPGDAPIHTLHTSMGSDRVGPVRFYTGQQSRDKGPRHSICVMQSVLLNGVVPM